MAATLQYDQLLEMISAFQWLPEQKRLRVEPIRERDSGTGSQVYGCLHHLAAAIERQLVHGQLPPQFMQTFMVQYVQRYTLLKRIDATKVVTEIQRLVQTIGVDLVLIGVGNAYVTACALVVRQAVPLEWNKFCDYVEKLDWKVPLSQCGAQSRTDYCVDNLSVEPVCEPLVAESQPVNPGANQNIAVRARGLASVFEDEVFAAAADAILNGCCDNCIDGEETGPMPTCAQPGNDAPAVHHRTKWGVGKLGR